MSLSLWLFARVINPHNMRRAKTGLLAHGNRKNRGVSVGKRPTNARKKKIDLLKPKTVTTVTLPESIDEM